MNDVQIVGTDLALIGAPVTALTVFGTEGGVDDILNRIKAQARAEQLDISTPAGRKAVASLAYKIARSKTMLDGMGKELGEANYKAWKAITAERARVESELDALRDEIRKPLTDWENADKARVAAHEAALAALAETADFYRSENSAADLRLRLAWLENPPPRAWEEFGKRAADTLANEVAKTKVALVEAECREAERAEAARIAAEKAEMERREREERIAAAAAEKARKDAEAKAAAEAQAAADRARREQEAADAARAAAERRARQAEQDRIASEVKAKAEAEEARRQAAAERQRLERERQEAQDRAARAEADRITAAAQAKADAERAALEAEAARQSAAERAAAAERQRIADEQAELNRATAAREADRRHRGKINGEARDDLVGKIGGITDEQATAIVVAIARGEVRHVRVSY